MPKNAKLLNVPVLGNIVRVLGSFAGVIGKTKDAEMRYVSFELVFTMLFVKIKISLVLYYKI